MFKIQQQLNKFFKVQMFPNFNRLNDIYYDDDHSEYKQNNQHYFINKKQQLITQCFKKEFPHKTIISRSTKPKPGDFQISFENGLNIQHQATFKECVQKLIEKSFKQFKVNKRNFLNPQLFESYPLEQPTKSTFKHLLASNKFLSQKDRDQFIEDIKFQDNLSNFMNFISTQAFQEIGAEFFFLVFKIWEKYIQIRDFIDDEDDIIFHAQNFTEANYLNFYGTSSLHYLNFDLADPKPEVSMDILLNAFKQFLMIFTSTILLVIDGYFLNPYCEEEKKSHKRSLREKDGDKILQGLVNMFQSDSQLNKPYKKVKKNN